MLEIKDVTRKFASKYGVANATLTIEPGKTYALLGPNGSGKTTLMKMIAGLMMPTSGTITYDGVPVGHKTKAHIAYMPTESFFYPYMSIMDAGKYYRDFFEDFDMARYEEILQRMDLNPKDKPRHRPRPLPPLLPPSWEKAHRVPPAAHNIHRRLLLSKQTAVHKVHRDPMPQRP